MSVAVFGGGCFWCTEAVFAALDGVNSVISGYCGGELSNPTYEQVCGKDTGHIEVVQVQYDPLKVSYETLLDAFFATHDPTTPNRQGHDVGPQYQSVIFFQDEQQQKLAAAKIDMLNGSGKYAEPVCTKLLGAMTFWPAESYHQNFFDRNPSQGYCQLVIAPKVQKFRKEFADKLQNSRN